MTTPSKPPEEAVAEDKDAESELKRTVGKGNEFLKKAKIVARTAEERLKKVLGKTPKEPPKKD